MVAVLGTGIMGAAMARSMRRVGLRVSAWNRTPAAAAPLADAGVEVCGTVEEALAGQDVLVTTLYDTDSVVEVVAPVLDGFDGVWLQMSTIGTAGIRRVAEMADQHGVTLLDAPVLGTRAPAEQGALVVLVSGDRAAEDRVRPVLDAVGSRTMWVGERPGSASALKLVVNSWVATMNAAVGQAVAMARGLGLDPGLFFEAVEGGPTGAPYVRVKGELMAARDYPVAFELDNARKDIGLIQDAARDAGLDLTLLDAVRSVYDAASAAGHGTQDMSAVHEVFAPPPARRR